MTDLIPRVGADVNTLHLNIANSIEGVNDASISGTSTSTSWSTISGFTTVSFTKLHLDTLLVVGMHLTCWINGSVTTVAGFGVQVNSVDYLIAQGKISTASSHIQVSGTEKLHDAALPAGTYTITPRMCRLSGSGTVTLDSNDHGSFWVREVYPL